MLDQMKTSMTNIVFVLSLICLLSPVMTKKYESNHQICKNGLKIMSIFQFNYDIFFQKQGMDGNILFFKMNETAVKDYTRPEDIPAHNYNRTYLATNFAQMIESRSLMTTEPINGHALDMESITHDCVNKTTEVCKEILDVRDQPFELFVCIFGSKHNESMIFQGIESFRYHYMDNTLNAITTQELYLETNRLCAQSYQYMATSEWEPGFPRLYSSLFYKITDNGTEYWRKYIVMGGGVTTELIVEDQMTNMTMVSRDGGDSFRYLFKYNRDMEVMSCPYYCQLDAGITKLTLIDQAGLLVPQESTAIDSIQHKHMDFDLNSFLRCNEELFDINPQSFCDQNYNFKSVFSLGDDLYFFKGGHYWRYSALGFNASSNPNSKTNINSIRFDSDFTKTLENANFDTSAPVMGFTYKTNQHSDDCSTNRTLCPHLLKISPHHFHACIYGSRITFPEGGGHQYWPHIHGFKYNPFGLQFYERDINKDDSFCTEFYERLYLIRDDTLYDRPAIMSITSLPYTPEARDNQVYLWFESKESHFIVYSITWSKKLVKPQSKDLDIHYNQIGSRIPPFVSLFSGSLLDAGYGHQVFGYGKERDGKLYRWLQDDINIVDFFKTDKTFRDIFKCPFDLSYSLVSLEERQPCDYLNELPWSDQYIEQYEWQSVFTLGGHLYYQLGRVFYTYDAIKRIFFEDKYITNLFNDYFDTNYRVTAYSLKVKPRHRIYEIVVYGKSNINYRGISSAGYLFAAFKINRTLSPTLVPINNPNELSLKPSITLGVLTELLDNKVIHTMAGIEEPKIKIVIWIEMHENSYTLHYTSDENELMFAFKSIYEKEKWVSIDSKKVHKEVFKRVVGMYTQIDETHNDILLFVIYETEKLHFVIYQMSVDVLERESNHTVKEKYQDLFSNLWCHHFGVQSSQSRPKTLVYFLGVLVLILILMALVVAFVAWLRNRKQNTENVDKKDKNDSKGKGQGVEDNEGNDSKVSTRSSKS